ncbi:MAG: DUF2087 domain-containing protein [Paracoccaceae bacterium]
MTKHPVPLHLDDITPFTRALSQQLGDDSPSHLKLMNMVARAAGFQNVQHMRASSAALRRLAEDDDELPADPRTVERALNLFDAQGRLRQWPTKRAVQTLALWALWSVVPGREVLREKDINACLNTEHLFDDPATLRRTMISCGLLTRERDGSNYQRVEQAPPPDAKAVIRALGARRKVRNLNAPETAG